MLVVIGRFFREKRTADTGADGRPDVTVIKHMFATGILTQAICSSFRTFLVKLYGTRILGNNTRNMKNTFGS